ncbi:YggT family protein [Paucilactobacillus suebicus]|uniref:Cell division membrane protein n=1 Tax=Paucilactobacillus suebicus DSM 5007 = KCTC 3549 TaxID=1423807 RepID=A0A0R1W4J4_9LACO|nr:YggT family protein [Paucilactobacillus suebicus]KRM12554.1 cell division membrane protein [Paucilactobacillus suebicus DSM 5007 = KCTC 3549]
MIGFIFYAIEQLLNLYAMVIVVWALLSWFPGASQSRLGQLLDRLVVPYIRLFNFIPPLGGISFSPLVALMVVYLAQHGVSYLYMLLV